MSCSRQSDTIEKTMETLRKSDYCRPGNFAIDHKAQYLSLPEDPELRRGTITKFKLFHGRQSESTVVFNYIRSSQRCIGDAEDPALIRLRCSYDVNRVLHVALNSQISHRCYSGC
jgi:hypothetical protein